MRHIIHTRPPVVDIGWLERELAEARTALTLWRDRWTREHDRLDEVQHEADDLATRLQAAERNVAGLNDEVARLVTAAAAERAKAEKS